MTERKKHIRCKNYSDIVNTISRGRFGKPYSELLSIEKEAINKIQSIKDRSLLERVFGEW